MRELLRKVSWQDYRELAKDLRGVYASDAREVWKRHIEKGPFGNFKRDPLRNWKWVILLG
jgi:hypothetical protein